jgi:hypothetical protein
VTEVACRLFHVETLAKAQVTQYIEDEPVHPIAHVEGRCPFAIFLGHLTNKFEPSVDVRMQEDLSISQCCLGEGVVEHTAFASMNANRGTAPSVDGVDIAWPQLVVNALLNVSFGTKDLLESRRSVENNAVRAVTELRTCYSSTPRPLQQGDVFPTYRISPAGCTTKCGDHRCAYATMRERQSDEPKTAREMRQGGGKRDGKWQ